MKRPPLRGLPPLGSQIALPLPTVEQLMLQTQDIDPAVWAKISRLTRCAYAKSTRDQIEGAYLEYLRWCAERKRQAVPATLETALLYFDHWSAAVGVQAMRNRYKAVALLHDYYGVPAPTTHPLVKALLRAHRKHAPPPKPKLPLSDDDMREIVRATEREPHPLIALRNCALMLFRFASAERTEETASHRPDDLTFFPGYIRVEIGRSKGDQFGEGQHIFIGAADDPRFCPVRKMQLWLQEYRGPTLFCGANNNGTLRRNRRLSANAIRAITKRYAALLGYDPSDFAGHSTRSGAITSGYAHDVDENQIQHTARHKHKETTRGYDQNRHVPAKSMMRQMGF